MRTRRSSTRRFLRTWWDAHRAAHDDRGTALLEAAIIFPILIMLVMGSFEFGMGWRDRVTVETAVRSGARVGGNLGNASLTDYNILQNVKSAMGTIPASKILKIVIYKADNTDGSVPSACLTSSQNSGSAKCNLYANTALSASSSSFGCGGGSLDLTWCPTGRGVSQGSTNGTDYLGVYLQMKHDFFTGMFGHNGITITSKAITRLEPQ